MRTRKNIDRFYQDRFKDVETTPREDVWKNIAARLPQKEKKKRIIPFWFKLAGTAAVLALLFTVGSTLLHPSENENTNSFTSFTSTSEEIKENLRKTDPVSTYFNKNMFQTTILLQSLMEDTKTGISRLKEDANTTGKTQKTSPVNNSIFADIIKSPSELEFGGHKYTFEDYNTVAYEEEERQKQIKEEIMGEKELRDLLLVASKAEVEPGDETKEIPPLFNRLSVRTTAAAVYFDNLGTGNTIDNQFGNNKSSGEVSISYGINLAYEISKKVKIRSGIIKVELSHNTQDVDYTAAVSAIAIRSNQPTYNSPGQIDSEAIPFVSSRVTGELSQQMGFIEIPVEIEYALIDKQIGLNIIGGASTLFLNKNMVSLHTPDAANNLGEAQNINNVSFSTNIGFGIDYNISPRFQWNLEPIFKYQLNTFNNSPGVKPYNFGIYSGFSFKF